VTGYDSLAANDVRARLAETPDLTRAWLAPSGAAADVERGRSYGDGAESDDHFDQSFNVAAGSAAFTLQVTGTNTTQLRR